MAYSSREKFYKYLEQKGLFPQESKSDYESLPEDIVKRYAMGGPVSNFDGISSEARKLRSDLDKELDSEFDKVDNKILQEQIDATNKKNAINSGNTAVAVADSKDKEIAYNKKRDFVNAMGTAWSGVGHFQAGGVAKQPEETDEDFKIRLKGNIPTGKTTQSQKQTHVDLGKELRELDKSRKELEKDMGLGRPSEYAKGGFVSIPGAAKPEVASGEDMMRKKGELIKAIMKEKKRAGVIK